MLTTEVSWKISLSGDGGEIKPLEIAFITPDNHVSGIGGERVRQFLTRKGWPKITPLEVYQMESRVEVVPIDPNTGEELYWKELEIINPNTGKRVRYEDYLTNPQV